MARSDMLPSYSTMWYVSRRRIYSQSKIRLSSTLFDINLVRHTIYWHISNTYCRLVKFDRDSTSQISLWKRWIDERTDVNYRSSISDHSDRTYLVEKKKIKLVATTMIFSRHTLEILTAASLIISRSFYLHRPIFTRQVLLFLLEVSLVFGVIYIKSSTVSWHFEEKNSLE